MNWTQVDIYTTTDGIDLLCSDLMIWAFGAFPFRMPKISTNFCRIKMASGITLTKI